eukprot:CAMPEP_0202970356 /NCGR_PEP_ID=MMETSP1396-20130829/16309_1 /ASSEMBLY_ACC=CAM_ASM_000872 /TAXON_ID= /ORGANISM="Pseudokeronopsis sp., Strain Brazil" /LENGTH=58 /DNA_ID=CAMNT_0049698791 /DNA_START=493 /DNA_END=669 /DNA_ORIENTATION=+
MGKEKVMEGRKQQAKKYCDHIQERIDLLKIVDVVKKIETENEYLKKIEQIEQVRKKKQ